MKASKFAEAQIAFVLKQADEGTTVSEVCRKAGISLRGPSVRKLRFMSGGRSTAHRRQYRPEL
jgi:hypothetical protein